MDATNSVSKQEKETFSGTGNKYCTQQVLSNRKPHFQGK